MALSQILKLLPEPHQMTRKELETALDSLAEKGLMAKEGSVYLSLALPASSGSRYAGLSEERERAIAAQA
jgi:hypothetical protein